jgi:PAS domain S-box-containing protein
VSLSEAEAVSSGSQKDDSGTVVPVESRPAGAAPVRDPKARRSLMSRIDGRINQSLDLAETLQVTVEELGAHLQLSRCVLWIIDESGRIATPVFQYRAPGVEEVSGVLRVSELATLGRQFDGGLVVADVRQDKRLRELYEKYLFNLSSRALVCLPVEIQGVPRALLTMAREKKAHKWTETEVELGRAVADRLALAMRQAELIRQLRESAREAEALYRASNLLVDTSDLDRLYEQILDAVADVFGHPNSNIWIVDEAAGEAVISYMRPEVPPQMTRRLRIDGPGLLAHSVRTASIVNVRDAAMDEHYVPGLLDTRSELLVPLMVGGKVIAVFNLESPVPGAFTERDERILTSFAERAARAVEQARLYNQAQESAAREALISRITRLLNQSLDVESMLLQLIEELSRHLALDWCVLAEVDSVGNTVTITRQCGLDGNVLPRGVSLHDFDEMGLTMLEGMAVHNDLASLSAPGRLPLQLVKAGIKSLLLGPVFCRRQLRFIIMALSGRPRQWTAEEMDLVSALASQASIACERAALFQEVTSSQREWEQTFDAMPEAVFVIDKDRRLSRANLAAAAIQGIKSGRPVDQVCCEVIAKSTGPGPCLIEQAISARQTIVKEALPPSAGRPFLFTIEPTFASDGASLGAIVIASDLTAIKRAEAEAEKQRQLLSRLLEIAHDAVFVLTVDSQLSWSNLRLSELSGFSPEELAGMTLSALIRREADSEADSPNFQPGGSPGSFEAELYCKDGARRYVIANITPIQESGEFTGALGILHDITDVRNAAEKAAQADKLRALGQLAGGVAHNFNNLLAAILGHTQLLKRHLKDSPLAERVEIIERAAKDGAAMVRRINSFSIRGGDKIFETVDLTDVVRDSLDITRIRWQDDARSRGIDYRLDFRPGPAGVVAGSPSELREVFVNIIFNALDAMSATGGRLLIETGASAEESYARFTDQGVGMTGEVLSRVFDPFFTTKGAAGTGLGLSGSHAIVERHGGRIEVESEAGLGSSFTVWLAQAVGASVATVAAVGKPLERAIMILMDEQGRREAIAGLLTARGYAVTSPSSSGTALALIEAEPGAHKVVFADLDLPGVNGLELAERIRALNPGIKVLLAASKDGPEFADFDARSRIDAVIAKPFHYDTVLLAVERALLSD